MFYRYASKITGTDTYESDTLASFADGGRVSGWAADTVSWAVGAGLINGTTSSALSPQGTATRAQVAAMVLRLATYTGQ
jgi:S-layer homology domain.